MKYKNTWLIFALVLVTSTTAFSQTRKPPLLKFADLQSYQEKNQTFRIVGYVFDLYRCPPCPRGMMCKPCIPDNIVIVDHINEKDMSQMKRLRILTEHVDTFERKGKYRFTVKVSGNVRGGTPVGEAVLIKFERVR